MSELRKEWNVNQKILRNGIKKKEEFASTIERLLKQHAMLYSKDLGIFNETIEDEVWDGLTQEMFSKMTNSPHYTIAYNMWHCTRIEDMTMNVLLMGGQEVINEDWMQQMNSMIYDTGNALTESQVQEFSSKLNMDALRKYRLSVGKRTQEIIKQLTFMDLKKKVSEEALQTLLDIKAVDKDPRASWLIDFWRKKDGAGLLLMPATRHILVHLNEAIRIKGKLCK